MEKTGLIIAVILLGLVFSSYAQVSEMPIVYTAPVVNLNTSTATFLDSLNNSKDIYANSPMTKAGDGVINAVSAWVDIPYGISEETENSNLFTGLTFGFGKGIVTGFKREAAGIVDFTTCTFPPYDKPLMAPEYEVSQPDRDGLKITVLSW